MSQPTLAVGEKIQARCTKCRKNSDHLIVSLADQAPEQVQCSLCSRKHNYRPPTKPRKPGVNRAQNLKAAEREEWNSLQPDLDEKKASSYSMTQSYKVNSLISHPVFGLGLVMQVGGAKKMEVLFADGRKLLRCK